MTYKHNLFTNSIELWIDEITSPSAYSRIREALKLACFREIAPVWATADRSMEIFDIFAIWACSILFKRKRSRWPEKMTREKEIRDF